jgi:DNA-binding NarL/FixJ family response regulator
MQSGRSATARALRVVLAEDTVLLRDGLARMLEACGLKVVAAVGDAESLMERVDADVDVAIVDIRMPPTRTTEGLEAALDIRRRVPKVGVLILSDHVEPRYTLELLKHDGGGFGYLLKQRVADLDAFVDAVRRVAAGGTVIDMDLVQRLLRKQRLYSVLDELTDRERDVLELMASGRSNTGIAAELQLSPKTVETHVTHVLSKLGITATDTDNRRVVAILQYLRA